MTSTPLSTPPQSPIGRIPVVDVEPLVDGGARPTKSVVGEEFVVTATVLREGGPFYTRDRLPQYLARLRATGRAHHAERLARLHPSELH